MRERGTTFINRVISMKRISKVATVLIGVIGVALALPMGSALTASKVMAQGNTPGARSNVREASKASKASEASEASEVFRVQQVPEV